MAMNRVSISTRSGQTEPNPLHLPPHFFASNCRRRRRCQRRFHKLLLRRRHENYDLQRQRERENGRNRMGAQKDCRRRQKINRAPQADNNTVPLVYCDTEATQQPVVTFSGKFTEVISLFLNFEPICHNVCRLHCMYIRKFPCLGKKNCRAVSRCPCACAHYLEGPLALSVAQPQMLIGGREMKTLLLMTTVEAAPLPPADRGR